MNRSQLIQKAASLPKGDPDRRRILADLKKANRPEIRIHRRQVSVNQAFADALQRKFRDYIIQGSPRGGFTYIHPESDTATDFRGGSDYDFYFRPNFEESGWYDVSYTPGFLILLQKDADKLNAHTTRLASRNPKPNEHVSRNILNEITRLNSEMDTRVTWAKQFHKTLQKEFYRLEDVVEEQRKAWVKAGKHPDDFHNPRVNPAGVGIIQARDWAEGMYRSFDPRGSDTITKLLSRILDILE